MPQSSAGPTLRTACRLCARRTQRHGQRSLATSSNRRAHSDPKLSNHAGPSTLSSSPAFHSGLTSLRKPHLDFPSLLASPSDTTRNHVLRRVRLPLGQDHAPRMVHLRERQGELNSNLGEIKSQQKALGEKIGQNPKDQGVRDEARLLKSQAGSVQSELEEVEGELLDLGLLLPNWSHPSSPPGPEENAKEVLRFGADPIPANKERDHLTLCHIWNLLDNEASTHTSGSSWPFLKAFLAQLEMALISHALSIATSHGFTPVITPDAVRGDIAWRCGFQPRDPENGATQIYQLHTDPGTPEMCLTGTAEIPLAGLYANKTFGIRELPSKVVGIGRSFRAEAGATGQDTRGLYRVHQFTKVEMFAVTEQEQSEQAFEELGRIQREIVEPLGFPVRVLEMPTEELGASAARKWDMEAWMPGRGRWGEITSTSNCTDYQSRRLHIRYRPTQMPNPSAEKQPSSAFAHTLNGTAAAIPRLIIALIENGVRFDNEGRAEGVDLPECLRRFWIGTEEIGLGKERGRICWV